MPRFRFSLPICALVIGCSAQPTDPSVAPDLAKGGAGSPGAIASVVVSPAENVLRPGWTQQLTATAKDAGGAVVAGVTFKWITSNPAVAIVTKGGLLTAVASSGPVTITAQTNTKQPIRGSAVVAVLSNHSPLVGGGYAGHQGHTCSLDALGLVWCWGSQNFGQLGFLLMEGDPPYVAEPTRTADATGLVSLAGGATNTCGLAADGRAFCWGEDGGGQGGSGTFTGIQGTPTLVAGGTPFTSLASNNRGAHHCALDSSGQAYCWGSNAGGQLGDGTTTIRGQPTPVVQEAGLRFATLAVGGVHTCGVTPAGAAYCWGVNDGGALGTGAGPGTFLTPQPVRQGALRFVSVTLGVGWVCALTTTGEVYCWGGSFGSFGSLPGLVPGDTRYRKLAAGEIHVCALDFGGEAYCFGSNSTGQLGDGTTTDEVTGPPVKVIGGLRFSEIGLGQAHTCARGTDGVTYCWGYNLFGQLGDGTSQDRHAPVATLPFGQ